MRDPEYDRFGPWAIEISEVDPPPPLFLPYLTRADSPLISIKIPRNIERRNAQPGMNLYDYLITLYENDLVILERVDDAVKLHTFYYRDIQYLRIGEHLLRGRLLLVMTEISFDLPYNTVSSAVMKRLFDQIRKRCNVRAWQGVLTEDSEIAQYDLSYFFSRLLVDQKVLHPEIYALASQREEDVGFYETTALRKLLFGVIGRKLLESLHLSDGRELKIISRGRTYKHRGQNIYGSDTCTIPISNLTGVTWEPVAQNSAVTNLILQTAGGPVSFTFTSDNPSIPAYARILTEMMSPQEEPTITEPT